MQITVNGKPIAVDGAMSVQSFIEERKLKPGTVVVEYNLSILKADLWASTFLKEGDVLEVLSFVGGG